jgi:adenylate cyclase class 2
MSSNGQETEAKFYVLNLMEIEIRLQDLGARLIQSRVLETNIRFDLPDARLRSERRVLRLRRDTEARLTYKSASTNEEGVLSRTEIEFIVEDFERAKHFLEALGYQPIFYYEKYRTTYELDKNPIMLDELPYGNFVEIEGETVESIRSIANQLNLNWDAAVATSYYTLFERFCTKRPDLDPTLLTFGALNGVRIKAEELSVQAADA